MGKKKEDKKFMKLKLSALEVDASLYTEGDPPTHRLHYSNRAANGELVSYNETLKRKIVEASDGLFEDTKVITFDEGFKVVLKHHRCYFTCPISEHKGGKHVIFFVANDLKPGIELNLNWDVKCILCHIHLFGSPEDKEKLKPKVAKSNSVQSSVDAIPASLPQDSNISASANVQFDHNAIKVFFDDMQEETKKVFANALDQCLAASNPLIVAENLQTEICLKIAHAYRESVTIYKNNHQLESTGSVVNDKGENSKTATNSGYSAKAQKTLEIAKKNREARLAAEEQEEEEERLRLIDIHQELEQSRLEREAKGSPDTEELDGIDQNLANAGTSTGQVKVTSPTKEINKEQDAKGETQEEIKNSKKCIPKAVGPKGNRKRISFSAPQNNIMDKYLKKS